MKLFACDFDGTFCFPRREVHTRPEDIAAVKAFQARGNLFGFCTGRPIGGLLPYVEGGIRADFYITSSGANVLERDLHPLFSAGIPLDAAQALLSWAAEQNAGRISVHADGEYYALQPMPDMPPCRLVSSLAEISCEMLQNISIRTRDEGRAEALTAALADRFGDAVTPFRNVADIDIVPRGCSKGNGLALMRARYPGCVCYGIGDSMNDLPLAESADVAYTFAYAPEALRRQAKRIVSNVAEALTDSLSDASQELPRSLAPDGKGKTGQAV